MDLVYRGAVQPHRGHVLTLEPATRAYLAALTGVDPANAALWCEALTHGSTGEARDYQRLEFLGDRVLALVIAEWLHEEAGASEGKLSQRLNALVARETCAAVARKLDLGVHIRLGRQARDDGAADSDNVLGDVIEALIGALFVEHGFVPARAFVRHAWAEAMASPAGQRKHPKAALQEWAAGNRRKPPVYTMVAREGPDHAARFTVSVGVNGVGEVQATGSSKQDAETRAAQAFMERFA